MSNALLIGNAGKVSPSFIAKLAKESDFILAADGGATQSLLAGVIPDLVIGDLDSISLEVKRQIPPERILFVDNQDNTDLEKALSYLIEHRYQNCKLTNFVGGRLDFSFGNLLALSQFTSKINLQMIDQNWSITPLISSRTINCQPNKRVSLLPLTTCTKVSLKGLKYPLKCATLYLGTTQTLSNLTVGNKFSIEMESGCLLVYQEF